jgi:translation initiation factor IF-1
MSKEETVVFEGVVLEALGNAMFKINLQELDRVVISQANGKIRLNRIRILRGDRVNVEFSLYDMTKGRIIRRL